MLKVASDRLFRRPERNSLLFLFDFKCATIHSEQKRWPQENSCSALEQHSLNDFSWQAPSCKTLDLTLLTRVSGADTIGYEAARLTQRRWRRTITSARGLRVRVEAEGMMAVAGESNVDRDDATMQDLIGS
jgi:hypothetical protein